MSSTICVHTATLDYFTSCLPDRFSRSPKAVKEAVMSDINDLVREFWRNSSHGAVGASFYALRFLFEILQHGVLLFWKCVVIIPFLRLLLS